MTNNIIAFDIGGVKVIKDSNTKIFRLKHSSSLNTHETLIDTRDNSNYQVPASKKATVIYCITQTVGSCNNNQLGYSDADDSGTGFVGLIDTAAISNLHTDKILVLNEIPALKWVIAKIDLASAHVWDIYIIEEDA